MQGGSSCGECEDGFVGSQSAGCVPGSGEGPIKKVTVSPVESGPPEPVECDDGETVCDPHAKCVKREANAEFSCEVSRRFFNFV